TVLDVIHYAGGLLPSADRSKIRLVRSFPKGSPVQVLPIDYEEISMGTDSSTDYQILPGDRLVVPRDPKYPPLGNPSTRLQQRSQPSVSPDLHYSRGAVRDAPGKQLEPLRSLEQRLTQVERKLDAIIASVARPRTNNEAKAAEKPQTNPDRRESAEPDPDT